MSESAREPRRAYGTDDVPAFLSVERVDDLARIVTQLTAEVWVLRDRLQVAEHLLAEQGCLPAGAIEDHQPDPAFADHLAADRAEFTTRVLGAPRPLRERVAAAGHQLGGADDEEPSA